MVGMSEPIDEPLGSFAKEGSTYYNPHKDVYILVNYAEGGLVWGRIYTVQDGERFYARSPWVDGSEQGWGLST